MLLYIDEVEIEDTNSVKLEWLIDIDDLSLSSEKKNFAANIDKMLVSIFGVKSFIEIKSHLI